MNSSNCINSGYFSKVTFRDVLLIFFKWLFTIFHLEELDDNVILKEPCGGSNNDKEWNLRVYHYLKENGEIFKKIDNPDMDIWQSIIDGAFYFIPPGNIFPDRLKQLRLVFIGSINSESYRKIMIT